MIQSIGQNKFSRSKLVFLAFAALLSSTAFVGLISRNDFAYELPFEFVELPASPSSEFMVRYKVAFREMLCSNYALHFASFGALLGLALGMVGAARNKATAIAAGVIGSAICGATVAALGGFFLGWFAFLGLEVNWDTIRLVGFQMDPFIQTTLLQCFIWICVGVGIGLGCTLATGSFPRMLKGIRGGLIGGALAGTIYSMTAAILFSSSSTFDFVPKDISERIVWASICGLSICFGLVFAFKTIQVADCESNTKSTYPSVGR